MGIRKTWILGAALCGALLCGANSQAGTISFIATGSFLSSDTGTSASGSSTVTYTSLGLSTATAPPTTNVSLGTFTSTTTGTGTDTFAADPFTLTITNVDTIDSITFSGTLSAGTLSATTSSLYMQFSTPLTQTLDGYVFTIASADGDTPGRLNLAPMDTNGGVSTLNGTVGQAVPEPASAALMGLAVPVLARLLYRRPRR